MNATAYLQFLRSKLPVAERAGIDAPSPCHESLKPHQRDICQWCIEGGRRAVFASFGLGKTRIHLQVAKWVTEYCEFATGLARKFLIVAPLGVRREFTHNDGPAMGLRVEYVRTMAEAEASDCDILITNYERVRDGDLDPKAFAGSGLDESSVLRSFGSKTYQTFLDKFAGLRFRFVFTATPSPNRYKELIHYAGFLGIMDTGEALTRFFQRDSSEAGNLTLYPHMEGTFWHWLRSWAVFIQSPSDLGHDATGYDLPPVKIHWHRLEVDHTANWTIETGFDGWGQGQLFAGDAKGLAQSAKLKRDSLTIRVEKAIDILHDDQRRKASLLQDLVCQKQGGAFGKTEGEERGALPGEQSRVSGTGEKMEGKQPGTHEGALSGEQGKKPGKIQRKVKGSLLRQQRTSPAPDTNQETKEGIQSNSGRVRVDERGAGRRLQDLPQASAQRTEPQGGSLPQDRDCEGPSVHGLQLRPGDVPGQYGSNAQSDSVSHQCIIWCDLNAEQDALERALEKDGISAASLRGSQDIDARDVLIGEWKDLRRSVFLSKPSMYGAGVNLQQCSTMIFVGIGYKFQDFIQGVHRIVRFQQANEVNIHVIYLDTEDLIRNELEAKWRRHSELVSKMTDLLRRHRLDPDNIELLKRTIGVTREERRAA